MRAAFFQDLAPGNTHARAVVGEPSRPASTGFAFVQAPGVFRPVLARGQAGIFSVMEQVFRGKCVAAYWRRPRREISPFIKEDSPTRVFVFYCRSAGTARGGKYPFLSRGIFRQISSVAVDFKASTGAVRGEISLFFKGVFFGKFRGFRPNFGGFFYSLI